MRFSSVLPTLLLSASLASAQQTNTIDFTTIGVYPDLKKCLKAVFYLDYSINSGPVQKKIGCDTNECICRADTLEQAVTTAGSMALSACSNTNDKISATSILTQYCVDHGFTAGNAVATPSSGAGAAVTVFATTTVGLVTQTQTVTVSSASELHSIGWRNNLLASSSRASTTPAGSGTSPTPVVQTQTTNIVSTISGSATTIMTTVTSTSPPQTETVIKKNMTGPIAGGVVGGVAVIGLVGAAAFWFMRKKQSPSYSAAERGDPPNPPKYEQAYPTTPYAGGMDMGDREVGGIQMYSDKP
ncbi:hypothetical protein H072_91 [Dactylellina haptotyla CBS 200.50]|uniref:Extracellular membrane protein CFEM domain-containing protein n=1 Tax=Dactylellina haptotyla (strain CBS 200.50) TaxID=1284197 RepID=S8CE51_DACHA|nr:hypothetical protein H072_91 [Dactylellina haptotyla CBS 200.50]